MKNFTLLVCSLLLSLASYGQVSSPQVYTNGGELGIRKSYDSTVPNPINTGQPFTYTIAFSASADVTNLVIEDILPSNLEFVEELSPTWLTFNQSGNTLTWTVNGLLSTALASVIPAGNLPGAYSLNLSVKFKPGVTCNGEVAENSVSIGAKEIDKAQTKSIPITAKAVDNWTIVKKPVDSRAIALTGTDVEYDIRIYRTGSEIGAHNLYNVSVTDLLPAGSSLVSSTCNFTTLDVTASGAGNPYSSPYSCKVKVNFPSATFSDSTCAWNTIKLTGNNPCDKLLNYTDSTLVCFYDTIPPIPPNPSGTMGKSVNMTNRVPGCLGRYDMIFQNNGNVDITDFVFLDNFPSNVTVSSIEIHPSNAAINYTYFLNGSNSAIFPTADPEVINSSPLTRIEIKPITLRPGESFTIYAYFELKNTVTSGQIINNIAHLNSVAHSISDIAVADIVVEDLVPKLKIRKEICAPNNGVYKPLEEFIYRIRVQNYGSANYIGGVLTDVLDPRLEFVNSHPLKIYKTTAGNAANPPCSGNALSPSGTIELSTAPGVSMTTSGQNLTVNLPTIPQNCASFTNNGYDLIDQLETYIIEFRVRVKNGTPPGQIYNGSNITNGTDSFDSNVVPITIESLYALTAKKEISIDGGLTYSTSPPPVSAGSSVRYKLTVTNSGNMNLTDVNVVDMLPDPADINLLACSTRGSSVNVTLLGNATTSPNVTSGYSSIINPDIFAEIGVNCGTTAPAWGTSFASTNETLLFNTLPSFTLLPGASEVIYFDVEIPITATTSDSLCNNFVVRAKDTNGQHTLAFSSNKVCIKTFEFIPKECCQVDLGIEANTDIETVPKDNYSYAIQNFTINNPALIPVTELRFVVTDISYKYNYSECEKCVNDPVLWGSALANNSTIGTGSNVLTAASPPSNFLSNRTNLRDIIWQNENGALIPANSKFGISYTLPPFSQIPCCATEVVICYQLSWKDANCRICYFEGCSEIKLGKAKSSNGSIKQSIILNPSSIGLPRLGEVEILSIPDPEIGMMLWDVDNNSIKVYSTSGWSNITN